MKVIILATPPLLLLLLFLPSALSTTSNDLDDACSVTRYRKLCQKSLAPYARWAGKSPKKWAQASMQAAIDDAKAWVAYMRNINVQGPIAYGVSDCLTHAEDVVDLLNGSLTDLHAKGMGDVWTYLSAAESNGHTCINDFLVAGSANSEIGEAVIRRAEISNYLIRNAHALALVLWRVGSPS